MQSLGYLSPAEYRRQQLLAAWFSPRKCPHPIYKSTLSVWLHHNFQSLGRYTHQSIDTWPDINTVETGLFEFYRTDFQPQGSIFDMKIYECKTAYDKFPILEKFLNPLIRAPWQLKSGCANRFKILDDYIIRTRAGSICFVLTRLICGIIWAYFRYRTGIGIGQDILVHDAKAKACHSKANTIKNVGLWIARIDPCRSITTLFAHFNAQRKRHRFSWCAFHGNICCLCDRVGGRWYECILVHFWSGNHFAVDPNWCIRYHVGRNFICCVFRPECQPDTTSGHKGHH